MAGSTFVVAMGMDVTMKGGGRIKIDKIAVHQVKDGKIVKEQSLLKNPLVSKCKNTFAARQKLVWPKIGHIEN